ncbi:MAG TPA: hypothetical protein VFA18_04045 [Gemmataceae bacterium]|nr:hypothetical protein [Gemmataceae bacterium]
MGRPGKARRPWWIAAGLALSLTGLGCISGQSEVLPTPAPEVRFQPAPQSEPAPDLGTPKAATPISTVAATSPPAPAPAKVPATPGPELLPTSWQQPVKPVPVTVWRSVPGSQPPHKPTARATPPTPELVPPPQPTNKDEPAYYHLDNVDVRKALEMASLGTHINLIVSTGVADETITANLSGLSPEQAIEAIARLGHLVTIKTDGVLYVYSAAEAQAAAEREGRLPVRVYHLNYVRAMDLEKIIKPLLTTGGKISTSPVSAQGIVGNTTTSGSNTSPINSPGGGSPESTGGPTNGQGMTPASANSGTMPGSTSTGGNSLAGDDVVVVRDQEPVLKTIDTIVAQVDVKPAEVLIEALIVSVELDKDHELGVNFAVLSHGGHVLGQIGDGALLNAAAGFAPAALLTAGGQVAGNSTQGFAADEAGLKVGLATRNMTAFIRALNSVGRTDVLACPRLMVLNKQPADLLLGAQLGYKTITQNFTSTTQNISFLDVGTLLRVRPFISSDGMVRMEIHPERSSGQVINDVPQTSTSQVTTNVMVPDGTTVVIGGLMENVEEDNMFGVPALSTWPVVGGLFRQHSHSVTKKELIVMLTPHIMHPACLPPAPVPPPMESMLPTLGVPHAATNDSCANGE